MAYYRDLREYLDALDAAGRLRRVSQLIDKDTELHPLVRWQFRGLEKPQRTGWLFENLTGHGGRRYPSRVATSIIGANREVYAMGLQCGPGEISNKWVEAYRNPIPPKVVSTGPCKEVVHVGDSLMEHDGLDEFAIPVSTNGWEPLPRLTAVSWHTRDPDTGVINVGTYNGLQTGPLRTNVRCGHSTGMLVNWRKCRERGIPLQAAAVIGAVPTVSMTSVARVPSHISEHDIAGGLMGEPLEVVQCETVDLLVPASSEIVLEGEIPTDGWELDGASGEHTGYMILDRWVWPFHVTAITHRKNPIWHDYISQMPPSESSTLRGIASEGRMASFLRQQCGIPEVQDVAFHDCAGAYRICAIRLRNVNGKRPLASTVWRALQASLAVHTDWPKISIAVNEDIDPADLESVMWAVCFRYQPHRDTKIIQGRTASLDQSARPPDIKMAEPGWLPNQGGPEGASAMLMDATLKWDYPPVSLPKKPYMDRARELWEELGFPPLTPREPWFGYELGNWSDKDRRLAAMAEQGNFADAAQELVDTYRTDEQRREAMEMDED